MCAGPCAGQATFAKRLSLIEAFAGSEDLPLADVMAKLSRCQPRNTKGV